MQKTIYVVASLCLLVFGSSCTKVDWFKDKFKDKEPATSQKDYLQVSPHQLLYSNDAGGYLPYLFKKTYDANGQNVKQLIVTYRYQAMGKFVENYDTLKIEQTPINLTVRNTRNTIIASFDLDNAGRPHMGYAYETMKEQEDLPYQSFNFSYSGGRISQVHFVSEDAEGLYAGIEYEPGYKNVKSISYYQSSMPVPDKVTYTYDYAKKATAQYYPDEMTGLNVWTFLQYINMFPELQGENLLTSSFFDSETYPGDLSRTFSNHKLDKQGRLVSYNLKENGEVSADWTITWK